MHDELEAVFVVPVPPGVRQGRQHSLWLSFELSHAGSDEVLTATHVDLIRMYQPRAQSTATMLLERDIFGQPEDSPPAAQVEVSAPAAALELAPADHQGAVPHFIYSRRHCELRLVTDSTPHASTHLMPDGEPIGSALYHTMRLYAPHLFVEQFSLLRKHALPLAADLSKPHPRLSVKLKPISLGRHRVSKQLTGAFGALDQMVGLGSELDELRELMSEERLYRFLLMQMIAMLVSLCSHESRARTRPLCERTVAWPTKFAFAPLSAQTLS